MATKHEKVLLAAFDKWPEISFTAEDLAVACWERFPDDFGLQGYERSHPDSNVVYRHIMGQSSIVKKEKWLLQTQSKTYKVSTRGVEHALQIQSGSAHNEPHRVRIERAREAVLARVLRSRAWQKWRSGDEIVFREACAFWGITPRSAEEEYRFARNELDSAFRLAKGRLTHAKDHTLVVPEAGALVSLEDLDHLQSLDTGMLTKFAGEIDAIKNRVVHRGRVRYGTNE